MVYCGKPSKGCAVCRARKIKCDQQEPACNHCIKSGRSCPGYRDQLALIFRDERDRIIRKSHGVKADKTSDNSTTSIVISSANSSTPSSVAEAGDEWWNAADPPRVDVSLCPPVEHQATCCFFTNFILDDSRFFKNHFSYLADIYGQVPKDGLLGQVISSLGMACLSNMRHAPQYMVGSRKSYAKSLQMVNGALRDTRQAKADETLMSVLLLGLYETITCRSPQQLGSWANHIDGAVALLELRGDGQFDTDLGTHLFFQVRAQLLTSCVQRELPVPPAVADRISKAQENLTGNEEYANKLGAMGARFCSIRAQVTAHGVAGSIAAFSTALALEEDLVAWAEDLPPSFLWASKSVAPGKYSEEVYGDYYHIYRDTWVSSILNNYRCIRILTNELILMFLAHLSASSSSSPTKFLNQCAPFHNTLQSLADDICASVPFGLGFDLQTPDNASAPKAAGGYALQWPLYAVATMFTAEPERRKWIVGRLQYISHTMGVMQASALAWLVEQGIEIRGFTPQGKVVEEGDEGVVDDVISDDVLLEESW